MYTHSGISSRTCRLSCNSRRYFLERRFRDELIANFRSKFGNHMIRNVTKIENRKFLCKRGLASTWNETTDSNMIRVDTMLSAWLILKIRVDTVLTALLSLIVYDDLLNRFTRVIIWMDGTCRQYYNIFSIYFLLCNLTFVFFLKTKRFTLYWNSDIYDATFTFRCQLSRNFQHAT